MSYENPGGHKLVHQILSPVAAARSSGNGVAQSDNRTLSFTSLGHGTFSTLAKKKPPGQSRHRLDLALLSWNVLPITVPIARQSILWPWEHRDPADRLLAATAAIHELELWHTDTVLKKLTGFPARYFANLENPPVQRPV